MSPKVTAAVFSAALSLCTALALLFAESARAQPAAPARVSGAAYATPICSSRAIDGEVALSVDRKTGRMVAARMQDIPDL